MFIKLTNMDGSKVRVNFNRVMAYERDKEIGGSFLSMNTKAEYLRVMEDPEVIDRKLKKNLEDDN